MKLFTSTVFGFLLSLQLFGQIYSGPIAKPLSGYGSDGLHTIGIESFSNPNFPTEDILIYHPSDLSTPVPTLFYSHAYGGNIPLTIQGLLNWTARKGYAMVFVPYQTAGVSVSERYENLLEGFRKAARDFPTIIDTTRVGFMGHSFGGGATFATAYACFTENNWGANGRLMNSSAPWYLFNISQTELSNFPVDVKLVVEIYNDDPVNDHRMAADAFLNIGIPNSEKDFLKVYADSSSGYVYTAEHDLPMAYTDFDAMDYYAYYRIIDALCDYAFNGNLSAKDVALGNGSVNQVEMPIGLTNLEQTDYPTVTFPESNYGFPCSSVGNPRASYCGLLALDETSNESAIHLFPNPVESLLNIDAQDVSGLTLEIYNIEGQLVLTQAGAHTIDVSKLSNGVYYCRILADHKHEFKKFVKQ